MVNFKTIGMGILTAVKNTSVGNRFSLRKVHRAFGTTSLGVNAFFFFNINDSHYNSLIATNKKFDILSLFVFILSRVEIIFFIVYYMLLVGLTVIAILTGIMSYTGRFGCSKIDSSSTDANYENLPDACKIANGMGVAVVATAILTVLLVSVRPHEKIDIEKNQVDVIVINDHLSQKGESKA